MRDGFAGTTTNAELPQPDMLVPWHGDSVRLVVDAEGDNLSARCSSRTLLEAILKLLHEVDANPERLRALIEHADERFLE